MKTVVIVQARMSSTRLPGKISRSIDGRTVLGHVLERSKRIAGADEVVVATSVRPDDDPILQIARDHDCPYFRGALDDVLDRYVQCARQFSADTVIRITSDCPLIDPAVCSGVLEGYLQLKSSNPDRMVYYSNALERTFPRGLDTEAVGLDALEYAATHAIQPAWREHVTAYIYQNPEPFCIGQYTQANNYSDHRWTLDTPEDWAFFQALEQGMCKDGRSWDDLSYLRVIDWLSEHQEVFRINQHVQQKSV